MISLRWWRTKASQLRRLPSILRSIIRPPSTSWSSTNWWTMGTWETTKATTCQLREDFKHWIIRTCSSLTSLKFPKYMHHTIQETRYPSWAAPQAWLTRITPSKFRMKEIRYTGATTILWAPLARKYRISRPSSRSCRLLSRF